MRSNHLLRAARSAALSRAALAPAPPGTAHRHPLATTAAEGPLAPRSSVGSSMVRGQLRRAGEGFRTGYHVVSHAGSKRGGTAALLLALRGAGGSRGVQSEAGAEEDEGGGVSRPDDESYKAARLESLAEMEAQGLESFPADFPGAMPFGEFTAKYGHLAAGERAEEDAPVSIAGRVHGARKAGKKLLFLDLKADGARVQAMCDQAHFQGDWDRDLVERVKRGDVVGVRGTPARNKRGELCLVPATVELLAPCMRLLPKEHFGLKDPDLRYRARHVDLMCNPEVREVFVKRAAILRSLRSFLDARGFVEVETPVLSREASGAAARPFQTHHNALKSDLFLRVAPELYLKRLVIGGLSRVYEVGKAFRNEGVDATHNPEFTSVEAYQAFADYTDMMTLTEELLRSICIDLHGKPSCEVTDPASSGGKVILDFAPAFARVDYIQALEDASGKTFPPAEELGSPDATKFLLSLAQGLTNGAGGAKTGAALIDRIAGQLVEPELKQPTLLMHHPLLLSPLARAHRSRPGVSERFELFMLGREVANAYSELGDPREQRRRFEDQAQARADGDDEAVRGVASFVDALEYGLPPTGGWGLGVDRLCMMLLDKSSIREVCLFPVMRPLPGEESL